MLLRRTTLAPKPPFSLKATVLSHGWHECAPMSWCEGGDCFQLVERDRNRVFRVSVTQANGRLSGGLRVTVEGEGVDAGDMTRIRRNLRVVLGLDRDLSEFYRICRADAMLHVVPRIGAGRGLRSADMAENIIKALCATNVNWTQAVKMINRLGQLGPVIPHFRNLSAWPTPREILRAGKSYLKEVCRVGYRAESILAFCRDVCEQRFDAGELDRMAARREVTSDDLLARLRSIRGIGPSSAHYLLSFLGRHDRLSIDSATVAHVARTHTNGRKPTLRQIERVYERYGQWRNLAWWYEHWLTWGTARRMLREARLPVSQDR
ncbi:MAG: DNA-3-methyladenine glycosylase family protein [Phycisphaerae bacterium]